MSAWTSRAGKTAQKPRRRKVTEERTLALVALPHQLSHQSHSCMGFGRVRSNEKQLVQSVSRLPPGLHPCHAVQGMRDQNGNETEGSTVSWRQQGHSGVPAARHPTWRNSSARNPRRNPWLHSCTRLGISKRTPLDQAGNNLASLLSMHADARTDASPFLAAPFVRIEHRYAATRKPAPAAARRSGCCAARSLAGPGPG